MGLVNNDKQKILKGFYIMTSIVQKIFVNRANAINADIVKNEKAILVECAAFFDIINDAHNVAKFETKNDDAKAGTDAIREAIMTDGHFAWLYDATGKANKKGIAKPIMSDHMRKIREGMLFLADENNAELFTTWAATDGAKKSGVCDFANIKKAIKPKAEKTATDTDADTDADADTDTTKRTKEQFLTWVFNQAFTEFGMDSADFTDFITSEKGAKVADDYVKAA
tara:strand:+ start:303 stop:980 length:678 start_codon:yes stop_codon:yes gene_type:complete